MGSELVDHAPHEKEVHDNAFDNESYVHASNHVRLEGPIVIEVEDDTEQEGVKVNWVVLCSGARTEVEVARHRGN